MTPLLVRQFGRVRYASKQIEWEDGRRESIRMDQVLCHDFINFKPGQPVEAVVVRDAVDFRLLQISHIERRPEPSRLKPDEEAALLESIGSLMTLLAPEFGLMNILQSWSQFFSKRWIGMNDKSQKLRQILKQNVDASLTLQLLNIPEGGKKVTLSNGTVLKATAARHRHAGEGKQAAVGPPEIGTAASTGVIRRTQEGVSDE